MNNSVKPILSLSLAAALVFGLAACNKPADPTSTPSATTSSSQPATQSPSSTPTTTPTPTPSESVKPAAIGNELKEAQETFPNIEVAEGVDKREVQLAMLSAKRYVDGIYNSSYLANGSWVKNGTDSQELVKLFGKDWSDSYRSKIEGLVAGIHAPTKEERNSSAQDLLRHFFFYDNSGMTSPDNCSSKTVGVSSCLVNGLIDYNSEMTYQVNKDNGSIYINMTFTDNVKFVKDGVPGVTPVHYDIQLEMIKNPYPDEENLRYAYIVNDLGGDWAIDKWHEGEK